MDMTGRKLSVSVELQGGGWGYQLRQIRPTIRSLTFDAANTIVQDWYNSLLYGVPVCRSSGVPAAETPVDAKRRR